VILGPSNSVSRIINLINLFYKGKFKYINNTVLLWITYIVNDIIICYTNIDILIDIKIRYEIL